MCYIKYICIYNISDAVKRKQLPAWIREGLEKMEREKQRKVDREQSFDEPEHSNFNHENDTQEMHNVYYIFVLSTLLFILDLCFIIIIQ